MAFGIQGELVMSPEVARVEEISIFTFKHFYKETKDAGALYGSLLFLREQGSKLW